MAETDLAQVGQQVVDAIVSTYLPDADDRLSLALHPGQAIADNVVQTGTTGEVSNALILSEWIADQYDYPLLLKQSDDTSVVSSLGDSVTGKAGYAAMVPWATPTAPPDSPTFSRVSSLISQARQGLGEHPDSLQFSCEPGDFAEPTSTGWHVFDTSVTTGHTETSTTDQPKPAIRANPELWQMRALPDTVVEALPARVEDHRERTEFWRNRIKNLDPTVAEPPLILTQAFIEQRTQRTASLKRITPLIAAAEPDTLSEGVVFRAPRALSLRRFDSAAVQVAPSVLEATAESATVQDVQSPVGRLGRAVRNQAMTDALVHVQIDDLAQGQAVTQTTTESSTLHVHFEYQLVRIIRRQSGVRWWRDELVTDPNWYVPGMRRGAMFNSPQGGDVRLCLPQALIVVRNVSITGSWTDEARSTLKNDITYVGPFLVSPPSETEEATTSGTSFAVLGAGIQVIGELCSPLPSLPPVDDPTLPAPPAAATQETVTQ